MHLSLLELLESEEDKESLDAAYCGTWDLVGSCLCPQQPQKEEVLMALSYNSEMWVIQNEDPIKV